MAVYSKKQMTDEELPLGSHVVQIVLEQHNKKDGSTHVFKLKNDTGSVWFHCFLNSLYPFAEACGVTSDHQGDIDTKNFLNKWVKVELGERYGRDGKPYRNVKSFEPIENPAPAQHEEAPIAHPKSLYSEDEDIPF